MQIRVITCLFVSDNTLLAIDSVPPHGMVQPQSYISATKSEEFQKDHKIQEILKDSETSQKSHARCENQQNYGQQGPHPQQINAPDTRQNFYNNKNKFFEQSQGPGYDEYQDACDQRQIVHMHNARNQQYYASGKDINQQFYTLPSRRPQREIEPPRSVTPDITRGLGRGSLSTMHMLARHGQKATVEQDSNRFGSQVELNKRNVENFEAQHSLMQSHQQPPIVDVRNRCVETLKNRKKNKKFK